MDPTLPLSVLSGLAAGSWLTYAGLRRRLVPTIPGAPYASAGELFRTLFEALPECVKLLERDGTVQRINPSGLRLLEAGTRHQVIGRPVFDFLAPDCHDAYRRLSQTVFSGSRGSMEFELLTLRGQRRWLETHAVPLFDRAGAVQALLAITRDISERRELTRLLEAQRNHLRTIIESEPECVKIHDGGGRISDMNPAGLALLDAEQPGQVLGRSIYEFLAGEYDNAYRRLVAQVFRGERASMEFEVVGLTGRRRWLETHAAPLYDGEGRVTALLAITRDIEQRKRDEDQLRRQRDELAHVCRLSTMGELAAGLAHELNQPLCAISSYAQSAQQAIRTPQRTAAALPLLEKIIAQSEQAHGIIERLRDLVRKRAPRPRPTDARRLIGNAVRFTEHEQRKLQVRLNWCAAPELSPIHADGIQIEQVLINLISNALHAMAAQTQGERVLSIALSEPGGAVVRFDIGDTGPGVPLAMRKHLFSPYFSTKRSGLGMGLAISRTIVEAHGGRIWHEGDSGDTRFCFELPVAP